MNVLELNNRCLKVRFIPELGGKIVSLASSGQEWLWHAQPGELFKKNPCWTGFEHVSGTTLMQIPNNPTTRHSDHSAPLFQLGTDFFHPFAGQRIPADGKKTEDQEDDRNPNVEEF